MFSTQFTCNVVDTSKIELILGAGQDDVSARVELWGAKSADSGDSPMPIDHFGTFPITRGSSRLITVDHNRAAFGGGFGAIHVISVEGTSPSAKQILGFIATQPTNGLAVVSGSSAVGQRFQIPFPYLDNDQPASNEIQIAVTSTGPNAASVTLFDANPANPGSNTWQFNVSPRHTYRWSSRAVSYQPSQGAMLEVNASAPVVVSAFLSGRNKLHCYPAVLQPPA